MSDRYAIEYATSVAKQLRRIDPAAGRRLRAAIERLADDPRPAGCRQLSGYPGQWRIRVGDYRVVYTVEDGRLVVLVLHVGHRGQVYDRL